MIHVYVGPTLPPKDPPLRGWAIRSLPPARHGDLEDPAIQSGHTVVLLDGVDHQAPALRHKEILAAISRGVRVIGAAGIGALRAAELHDHGVIGSGRIYKAYARGELTGDDEVAVWQAPDGDRRAQTWPLVSLRHILRIAERERVLSTRSATLLLSALAEVPYQQRTKSAIRSLSLRIAGAELLAWVRAQRTHDPHWGDLKRRDAFGALALARSLFPPRPRGSLPVPPSTDYTRAWTNRLATEKVDGQTLPTSARLAYQQIFDPLFPQVWSQWLEHLARQPDPVEVSRRLAYVLDDSTDPAPAPHLVFRPVPDLRDPDTMARLLVRETAADRDAVARYASDQVRESIPEATDDAVALRALAKLWRTDAAGIETAAAARGFHSAQDTIDHQKRFVLGFLADAPERTS
ncbi:TfuA domain-containing protein [Streptomyces sp. NBC_00249]|uniref:TfuA domain-containing protein n=1 Tax=Streptomyces sp. NBC_00249 TaxID=2975690 RepID=UPI002253B803|nr:TfuA domain-containing protein [Streptomyces sp. NBC_00249]MCX5199724.1 TfuA domain-containing protein [Streptomyces sp. NBC_00249]